MARSLVLDGAEVLCVLANWEEPHIEEWRSYVLARAYENAVFVAAAAFFGGSMIVGPRGTLHAAVDEGNEGYGIARINLEEVRKVREEFQFLRCRQPSTYRAVVRKSDPGTVIYAVPRLNAHN